MIQITKQPLANVTSNGSIKSKLLAAHNPAIIGLQRKDFPIKDITDNGGSVRIILDGGVFPTQVTVGARIYLFAEYGSYMNGSWQVTAWNGFDEIDIDLAYSGGASTYSLSYVNLTNDLKGYFIRARVYKLQPDNTYVQFASARLVPFTDGSVFFDLMPYNKQIVQETFKAWYLFPLLTAIFGGAASFGFPDKYGTGGIKVDFSEQYIGVDPRDPLEDEYLVANASMQATHTNGVNMKENYQIVDNSGYQTPRFYKPLGKIRWWDCMGIYLNSVWVPFANFLTYLPQGLDTTNLDVELRVFAGNTTLTNIYKQLPNTSYNPSAIIDQPLPSSKFGWCVFAALSPTELNAFGATKPDRFTVRVVDSATHSKAYTETVTVRYTCSPRNPIVIGALNHFGGWSWFVFGVQAAKGINTQQGGAFSRFSTDSLIIPADSTLMGKSQTPELTIGADDLDNDDLVIINTILSSPLVKVLAPKADSVFSNYASVEDIVLNQNTVEYHDVKVVQGSYSLGNSKANTHKVEFKIQFSEHNLQSM